MMIASARLPDGREESARLSAAYGPIREACWEYVRQALAARPTNVVRNEAERKCRTLFAGMAEVAIAAASFFGKKDTAESAAR